MRGVKIATAIVNCVLDGSGRVLIVGLFTKSVINKADNLEGGKKYKKYKWRKVKFI